MNGLLISVGTGVGGNPESIINAIKLSIENKNPEKIAFLISPVSEENAKKVVSQLGLSDNNYSFFTISDSNNINSAFLTAEKALNWLIAQGIEPARIIADFTSGTKPMSAAVVAISILRNINKLSYVQGQRKNGIVVAGTEQANTFSPFLISFNKYILDAKKYLERYQYESALSLLKFAQKYESGIEEEKVNELNSLFSLINAYRSWDIFDHFKATGEFKKVDFKLFEKYKPRDTKILHKIGHAIKKETLVKEIIVDLFANAKRRLRNGKYDDCVARLYRIVEMTAQWQLKEKYEINTGDIDLDKMPDKEPWKDLKKQRDGKIKIALYNAYELLKDFNDPLGFELQNIEGILNIRNYSILAHGVMPIGEKAAKSFIEKIEKILQKYIQDFDDILQKLEFPWDF